MAEIMNKDEDIRSTWDSDTGKLERIKDIEAKQKALEIQRQELVKAEEKEKDRSWKSEENEKNREAKADSDKKHRELMLALKKSGDSKEKALAIKDLKSDIDKSSAEYEKERTAYNKSIKGTTADMLPEDAKQEYAELENKRLSLEQKAKDYYELTGRAYLPGGLLASDKKQQPGYTNSGSGNELASYMSRIDSNPKIPPQEKQRLKKMAIEAAGKGKY
jgi:hypothetical protein